MKSIEDIFNESIIDWRNNKGIGTALIPFPFNDKVMLLGILQKIYTNNKTANVLVITNDFKDRLELIEYLTRQNNENDEEFKKLIEDKYLKIYTSSFVQTIKYYTAPLLTILYHPSTVCDDTFKFALKSKFRLIIINKRFSSSEEMNVIYNNCPILKGFKQIDAEQLRMSSPVEETLIDVEIDTDSEIYKTLTKINNYISTSMSIFGSLDQLQNARQGNRLLNMSAIDVCYNIAYTNGWTPTLDMSIEYNRELDNLFNPNHIFDRANELFNMIRNRCNILSDYDDKLNIIYDIVKNNQDKKILIISKRGEFANTITAYLNNMSENIICGNYHDKVEKIPSVDINGNPIYYKSGVHKGERVMMAADAQKTLNMTLYNYNKINVLSTNNSPDKNLNVNVDIVIITSSLCDNVENYLYRLSNVNFASPLQVYTIYVKNSLEELKVNERMETETHKIVKNHENRIISENNSDFIVVD